MKILTNGMGQKILVMLVAQSLWLKACDKSLLTQSRHQNAVWMNICQCQSLGMFVIIQNAPIFKKFNGDPLQMCSHVQCTDNDLSNLKASFNKIDKDKTHRKRCATCTKDVITFHSYYKKINICTECIVEKKKRQSVLTSW